MKLEPIDGSDARAVLRGLRGAVLGAGPAIALSPGSAPPLSPTAAPRPGELSPGSVPPLPPSAADAPGGTAGSVQPLAPLPDEVPPGTAVVLETSGSTGYPKRVLLSRAALTASALATADRIGDGAWLLALPAHYIAGAQVLVRALISGREPAILAGSFSPQAFAAAAGAMASSVGGVRIPTYTSLVPAQLRTLLDAEDAGIRTHLADFEAVLVGGQALPPALAERASAAGVRVVRTYGSTETSGGCVYDGVPLRGVEVVIRDGEVMLSGPTLADGYLDDPLRTGAVFVTDGGVRRYRTGDAGTFDSGILRVAGRRDNVIVSGGVNVSLDRVERVIQRMPGLEDVVVVPMPDERWGEASVVVTATVGAEGLLDQVRAAVAAELGAPARPRAVVAVARIPVLPSGKPDRAAARALAVDRGA